MKIMLTSFNPQIFAKVLVFYVFKEKPHHFLKTIN